MSAPAPDEQLRNLMRVGLAVVAKVRTRVPMSGNYGFTSSPIHWSGEPKGKGKIGGADLKDLKPGFETKSNTETKDDKKKPLLYGVAQSEINAIRKEMQIKNGTVTPAEWIDMALSVNEVCRTHKMGNCGELALIAAATMAAQGYEADYVEISAPPIGDQVLPHLVCVVGRTGGSTADRANIGLPDTWGASAVVIDPWDRVVYPASMYLTYWNVYQGKVATTGGGIIHHAQGNTILCHLKHRFRPTDEGS